MTLCLLYTAPAGLLFEGGQLVAASHDMVVVLQLLDGTRNTTKDHKDSETLYSGHMQVGRVFVYV